MEAGSGFLFRNFPGQMQFHPPLPKPRLSTPMKTRFLALTMAAALSCGSLPLLAQDAPPPPPPPGSGGGEGRPPGGGDRVGEFIKRADADNDGKLSKDEFVGSTKKEAEDRFAKIDANADGFIEKSEAEDMARRARDVAQQRPEGMRRPEGAAGERDGGVRPRPGGEQAGSPPAGPDGQRRPEGFRRPDGEGGPRPEGFRRPDGEGGGSPGMRQGGGGGMNFLSDRLRRMDKNDDKSVSKEEFHAASEEQFAQMDENKDGNISNEEIEAMSRRMREMMGGGGRGGEGGGFRRPGGEGGRDGGARPRPEGEGERPRRPEGEAPAAPAPQN